jgi:hypothetical protein
MKKGITMKLLVKGMVIMMVPTAGKNILVKSDQLR